MENKQTQRGMSSKEAAVYLGISEDTLRRGRVEGHREGHLPPPPFIKAGRKILYLKDDLDCWLEGLRVTSETEESR